MIRAALISFVIAIISAPVAFADRLNLENVPVIVHYDRGSDRVAKRVGEICEATLPEITAELGVEHMTPIDVICAQDMSEYRDALGSQLPQWGVAFAMLREQQIVVDVARATRAFNSLDEVVPHELSHLILAQKVGEVPFPIWFVEGLAQWQAHEWTLVDNWELMNAVWSKNTPTLRELMSHYPVSEQRAQAAYRISYAAFADLYADRPETLPPFLDLVKERGDFLEAFDLVHGEPLQAWAARFQNHLEQKYHSPLLIFQSGPLFSLVAVLFLVVIFRHIIRNRRKVREMERQFTADDWDAR